MYGAPKGALTLNIPRHFSILAYNYKQSINKIKYFIKFSVSTAAKLHKNAPMPALCG